jgi:pheromone shutdown protein TraB
MRGIAQAIQEDNSGKMAEISSIPPVGMIWHIFGWSIPVVVILSIAVIAWQQGLGEAGANVLFWVLATGVPAAVGAVLALSHPMTILSAFVAAPFTTLSPVIGVGHVCAFVQVMAQPPLVKEFDTVTADIGTMRGWCSNRLLRVFLAFTLPGFGASLGTFMGGYKIFSSLFN